MISLCLRERSHENARSDLIVFSRNVPPVARCGSAHVGRWESVRACSVLL